MRRAFVMVVGALLSACGGSSGSHPDGGNGGTGDATAACGDYANKYCARLQACSPGYLTLIGFSDAADCVTSYQTSCVAGLAAMQTADTSALTQQCGDGLAAMTCTQFLQGGSVVPACAPHGGTFANGTSCNNPWQCASGRCFMTSISGCGACVAVIASGQPCDNSGVYGSDCADGLYCALTTAGATTPVCTASVALGGACADSAVCPANASCDGTTHVCSVLPTIGQSCDPSATYICDPTKVGALCDSTTSLCKAVTAAPVGGACGAVSEGTATCNGACDLPSADAGAGICQRTIALGQSCTAFDLCVFGTTCTGGICAATACNGTPVPPAGNDAGPDAGPTDAAAGQ